MTEREFGAVMRLVMRHGRTATAFRAVGRDLRVWFDDAHEGAVAYAEVAGAWVAAGEPVAPLETLIPVAEAFVAEARAQRRRVSFFATEGRLATSPALSRRLLGEQPIWDPRAWSHHVASHRSLREQVRRARAKGVTIAPLIAAELSATAPSAQDTAAKVERLLTRWRAARSMATMHFLVTVDLTSGGDARRQFAAWQDGQLVGLLSLAPVPARKGWLFEHLLRDPDAPNGTLELLVDHVMRTLANEGVPWATLGLAPLHGDVDGWLRRLRRWSTPLFNFEGLAAFKRKLRPTHWEPIYLAWPRAANGWRALLDGLRAFAGGSLLRFGVLTFLRGPSPILLALEWLLVPWTLTLALAPTTTWFPSRLVHAAWVAFDGVLLLALRHQRQTAARHGAPHRRHAAKVAVAVATAVTLDAILTAWQAIEWNASRAVGPLAWVVLLVACAGPLLAMPVLWGSARRLCALAR